MNQLKDALSPYLLQHANNPVDWRPWSEAAFALAKAENKPVLVSIGYAACHWCHVMERESFENDEVAHFMNTHFICVKVDREEHPEVDHLYMDALQSLNGSGGWPLNMFVTPEKKPFYGGTYFPPKPMYQRASWMQVLQSVARAWRDKPEDIALQAEQMTAHLKQAAEVGMTKNGTLDPDMPLNAVRQLLETADPEGGGFGAAPKFPATFAIGFLLEFAFFYEKRYPEEAVAARRHALFSLDKMISGGIYDQVGGGFARYATDRFWLVPHFEKMLYDNALMISVLADAYKVTGDEKYREVIEATIDFCNRELRHEKSPLYFCALDADSDGEEGKFYTWTNAEWEAVMGDAHPALKYYFGVTEAGNWEHTNILTSAHADTAICERFEVGMEEWKQLRRDGRDRLLRARALRNRPQTDDKVLLSWNALMNTALTNAGAALGRQDYLEHAKNHLAAMVGLFKSDRGWYRAAKNGKAYLSANLEDYAYLIDAMLRYAEVTGATQYVQQALSLTKWCGRHFQQDAGPYYYFSAHDHTEVPVRKIALYDGATPSANAMMTQHLLVLAQLTENTEWQRQAESMLAGMLPTAGRYPRSFACWAQQGQRFIVGRKLLVITGADEQLKVAWAKQYNPQIQTMYADERAGDLPAIQKPGRQVGFYLCERFQCREPLNSLEKLLVEIKK